MAEVAVVGGAAIAGAAVATAVTANRAPPPRREVVVVPAVTPVAAAPVATASPVVGTVATAPVVVVKGKGKGKGWKGKGKGKTEVIEVPPLGVSAVGIPASAVSKQGGVTFFGVDVVSEAGGSYRVQKRYNDFDQLKDK